MTTKIPTSRFVWFDYVAADADKAFGFYGELFGWKTQQVPVPSPGGSPYTLFLREGQGLGGFFQTPKGAPAEAHWLPHLQVQDANATSELVKSLGGKVLKAPVKMGEHGTMAILGDPLDGAFAVWQPAKPEGNGDFKGVNESWCWNELCTSDVPKSLAFYAKVGDFTAQAMPMPNGDYHMLNADGQGRAGVTKPEVPMKQQWMPYVQVGSTDQTVEKAKRLGATIHVAGQDIPAIGRIAIFSDNQGAMIGVLQPA